MACYGFIAPDGYIKDKIEADLLKDELDKNKQKSPIKETKTQCNCGSIFCGDRNQ